MNLDRGLYLLTTALSIVGGFNWGWCAFGLIQQKNAGETVAQVPDFLDALNLDVDVQIAVYIVVAVSTAVTVLQLLRTNCRGPILGV